MQTNTYTLNLETDYNKNGNSTGSAIDTLGIAFGFGDINDASDRSIDYIYERVENEKRYWIKNIAEDYFKKSLTSEQIVQYVNDLQSYDEALDAYRDTFENVNQCEYDTDDEAQKALAQYLETAEGEVYDELYQLWLHGDYREGGLLDKVNRHYRDYNIEISDGKQGTVEVTVSDDTVQSMIDDNILEENATVTDVIEWLKNDINYRAYSTYQKEQADKAKRREERERVAKYQAEQKQKADERRKAELLALKSINKK